MIKITNKLLLDYICGNDIDTYSIEALENDCDFMLAVINYTKDKNMYDLCSDELKKDYNFAKNVISMFKKDVDFINDVASFYLNYSNDDVKKLELNIIMSKLLVDTDYNKYDLSLAMDFVGQEMEIDSLIDKFEIDCPEYIDKLGKGFCFIVDKYSDNEIIMNYYVKTFCDIILSELEDFDFERVIHSKIDKSNNFNKEDFYNVLIDILKTKDVALADYVSVHLDSICYYDKRVEFIKNNWDNYLANEKNYRHTLIYKLLDKYSEDNNYYDYYRVLGLINDELNLGLNLYEGMFENFVEEGYLDETSDLNVNINDETYDVNLSAGKIIPFEDMRHYNNIKKLIVSVINSKDLVELEKKYFYVDEIKNNSNKRKR